MSPPRGGFGRCPSSARKRATHAELAGFPGPCIRAQGCRPFSAWVASPSRPRFPAADHSRQPGQTGSEPSAGRCHSPSSATPPSTGRRARRSKLTRSGALSGGWTFTVIPAVGVPVSPSSRSEIRASASNSAWHSARTIDQLNKFTIPRTARRGSAKAVYQKIVTPDRRAARLVARFFVESEPPVVQAQRKLIWRRIACHPRPRIVTTDATTERTTPHVCRAFLNFKGLRWCGWRDLNPHALRRQNLNLVRLPISPHPQRRAE